MVVEALTVSPSGKLGVLPSSTAAEIRHAGYAVLGSIQNPAEISEIARVGTLTM